MLISKIARLPKDLLSTALGNGPFARCAAELIARIKLGMPYEHLLGNMDSFKPAKPAGKTSRKTKKSRVIASYRDSN